MLRQTAAILFLMVHLFNIGGYRILFDRFEQQASHHLIAQLDNEEYADDQLMEIKVPLPVPYQTNWSSFERVNGEIVVDGIQYNYVKRKVWNDTLIVLCIPNHQKMKLNSAKEQFFSLVNDLNHNNTNDKHPSSKDGVTKSLSTDFQLEENKLALEWSPALGRAFFTMQDDLYGLLHVSSVEQPPEIC